MRKNEYRDEGEKCRTVPVSKMNNRGMFGKDEKDWPEYR